MPNTAVFTPQSPPADPALRQPLQVASLLPRFGAYLIDALILMVASWIVFFVLFVVLAVLAVGANGGEGFSYSSDGSEAGGLLVLSLIYALAFLPPLAYFTFLPSSKGAFNGRTIGKRAVGLRVINADGTRITPGTARRRGLAFFGPTFIAVVLGTLLDGLAGTPLIFTGILATVAVIYNVTDFTFAPAGSDLRATLHDRAAKTVVVLAGPAFVESTDAPAPIVPRPRTGRLNLLNVAGGLYLLMLITGIVLVVAVGSSDTTSDASSDEAAALIDELNASLEGDEASGISSDEDESASSTDDSSLEATDAEDSEPAGTGKAELRDGAVAATLAEANAKSAAGAQRQARAISVIAAHCIGQINDYYSCGSGMMGEFIPDLSIEGTPTRSTPTKGYTAVIKKPIGSSDPELTMVVYDRDDVGWGYRFREQDESITPVCLSFARNCEATKAFERFVSDKAALGSVKKMFRDAPGG